MTRTVTRLSWGTGDLCVYDIAVNDYPTGHIVLKFSKPDTDCFAGIKVVPERLLEAGVAKTPGYRGDQVIFLFMILL